MGNITGTLSDFGLLPLADKSPRVIFRPTGPTIKRQRIMSSRDMTAYPDSFGNFNIGIENTFDAKPYVEVDIIIEWLEPGATGEQGYKSIDVLRGFKVPPQNGSIGDLIALDYDPQKVWVSASPPTNPAISTWWLNSSTGDLYEWE